MKTPTRSYTTSDDLTRPRSASSKPAMGFFARHGIAVERVMTQRLSLRQSRPGNAR